MTTASLQGVILKLNRAEQHIDTLDHDIREFMFQEDTRHGIAVATDGHKGEILVTANLKDPFPPGWGPIIGDAFHNLRSALDHLAWQLVIACGNDPTKHTEFPIFRSESLFDQDAPRKMAGISPDCQAVIKGVQPFRINPSRPELTVLWAIHEYNRIDKHQILHPTKLVLVSAKYDFDHPKTVAVTKRSMLESGVVEDGAILAHFTWPPIPASQGEVEMQMHVSADVAFEQAAREGMLDPVVELLRGALDDIRTGIVPAFSRWFCV